MEVGDIILLLEFCLKNTYFFQDQFYEQVEGAAMGSPVSPIVANLYMEYLEQKALSTAPNPPRFWCRYVDDTFVIHKEVNKQGFLQHINSVDPAIKFTVEDNKDDGSIPFLDTIVKPEADCTLSITVDGNPLILTSTCSGTVTITSQPNLVLSIPSPIGPPLCAASLSCSNKKRTISGRLSLNANIPNGLWTRWRKLNRSTRQVTDGGTTSAQPATNEVKNKGHIVIPYTQGLCESIKKICGRYGIQTHFKGGRTIKNLPVSPKEKDPMVNQNWCHLLVPMW